jgi:hypothetical protein
MGKACGNLGEKEILKSKKVASLDDPSAGSLGPALLGFWTLCSLPQVTIS